MFLCYPIDPAGQTIEQVEEGFARAAELTGSQAPQIETVWSDITDPDSSVDLVYDPDAEDQPPFRLRLHLAGEVLERVMVGRTILLVCGNVPAEIANQVASIQAAASAIEFTSPRPTEIARWLKAALPENRSPARRHGTVERVEPHRVGRSSRH